MANFDSFKIPIVVGVNDTPLEPNASGNGRGCNGSYFIDKFHGLIDEVNRRSIKYESKSANFTASPYIVYGVDTTSGPITATLGPATGGDVVYFTDAAANFETSALTISASGTQILSGASLELLKDYECIALIYDSTANNWVQWGIESSGTASEGGESYRIINGQTEVGIYNPDGTVQFKFWGDNYGSIQADNIFLGAGSGGTDLISNVTDAVNNVCLGNYTGGSLTTGDGNVAVGYLSAGLLTSGADNTSLGTRTLINATTASYNVVVGNESAIALTTGNANITIGTNNLYTATSCSNQIAIGADCLFNYQSTTPFPNIAIGINTLYQLTTGEGNVAVGMGNCSSVTTGELNCSIGNYSLVSLQSSSSYNTGIGCDSFSALTSGNRNTSLGYLAGETLVSGSDCVFIGALSGSDTDTTIGEPSSTLLPAGLSNVISIGYKSVPTASNQITLGNSVITTLRCAVTSITSLSDARDKTNIETLSLGLDFISTLNPVKFTWNTRDGAKVGQQAAGFIAQDLQAAQQGNEYLNLVLDNNPDKLEATPGNLIPVMIKAIQDLKQLVDQQAAEIALLKQPGN